jgi:HNH endonuclease/NUMOD4 motif-containing protein
MMKKRKKLKAPEIWKSIPGYDGYSASTFGRIRKDFTTERSPRGILKGCTEKIGYIVHRIKRRNIRAHVLVLTAFSGYCPDGLYGLHKNDNKGDNRLSNLYWGTQSSNMKDRYNNGYKQRYTDEWREKLSLAKKGIPWSQARRDATKKTNR